MKLARNLFTIALSVMLLAGASLARAQGFDHSHAAWNALLAKHVKTFASGNASAVDYAAIKAEHTALKGYLAALSAVGEADYGKWNKAQRLAFLINAYNAFTVELILSKYPDIESIKDLGSVFSSPWKKKFFTLLGQERHLDDIEHGIIRAPGAFDDPRIHVGVVCASIGCPMLRPDAFTPEKLDAQLDDGMKRFLADGTRNRFDAAAGRLQVSKIFDWYGKDFEKGHKGYDSLKTTFARHAAQLAATPEAQARVRNGDYKLEFLDYDWRLNDIRR
ncbi:DUF547 domain-containing protein [Sulfuritalea sp.]|uniref:DUF547 domain-containing protein n=1 Tax=Sulfuritalea sp. TaxID=2480090 RepID=UPI001AD4CE33|nr:DUF547 domain-containing protein [Sulfuritalea sp.]MBN8475236.1 DUF547 domain-containing protein [Sulfuritalea sp.]